MVLVFGLTLRVHLDGLHEVHLVSFQSNITWIVHVFHVDLKFSISLFLYCFRKQMPATLDGQLTIEKTPGYFPNPDVPRRIYKMNKDIKLVVIFREPVSRLISDYAQSLTKGKKPPLEDQVLEDYNRGIVDTSWSPVFIGQYSVHLKNWLPYFPLKQFLFLNGENLVHNPAKELIKMQEFLGLDVVIDETYFYFNKTKGFPCLKKGESKQDPKCLGESKGRPHPKVDPYVVRTLQSFYKPYNERLYEMTGIDFHWETHTPAKLWCIEDDCN